MFTNFKRVFHFAIQDFFRNKGMSLAAIFVLIVTILLVTGLFFVRGVNAYLVETVQNKIDITAYFKADTAEEDILQVRKELLAKAPDIKTVEYVSKDQALAEFNEKHSDNPVFSNALTEVGGNPFLPALNITTTPDTAHYEEIANILSQPGYGPFIEKVDFSQKKDTIEKVFTITNNINKFGIGLGIVLMLVVILVVFNTIRLVIENSKAEITTQRLVGASAWFVRAPFVIEGALFGLIAAVVCFIITLAFAYFASPASEIIMPGFSLFRYFITNILLIIAIQIVVGAGLGVLSSSIVVRRYLKV